MYLRLKTAKSHITSILVGDFCSDDLKNWEELRIRVYFSFSFSFFFFFTQNQLAQISSQMVK